MKKHAALALMIAILLCLVGGLWMYKQELNRANSERQRDASNEHDLAVWKAEWKRIFDQQQEVTDAGMHKRRMALVGKEGYEKTMGDLDLKQYLEGRAFQMKSLQKYADDGMSVKDIPENALQDWVSDKP